MIQEVKRKVSSGYVALVVLAVAQIGLGYLCYVFIRDVEIGKLVAAIIASIIVLICWAGLFMVHPNEAKVLQLFGKYAGTCHDPGLRWANPFYTKTSVSIRIRNFESGKLKVNDSNGSPIEIAAVVVWKVVDSAEAIFEVDDTKLIIITGVNYGADLSGPYTDPIELSVPGRLVYTAHDYSWFHGPIHSYEDLATEL